MKSLNLDELYPREKYLTKIRGFYHECEIIKVITGVRRCGKSSIMKMIIGELIASGVSQEDILYFNLDKRPYLRITEPEQLDKLIEKGYCTDRKQYLFIDEVQNVRSFESVLNSWREEGNVSIFLTGSNSYLLSGELATKLTGRYLEFNILPLTPEEFVGMKHFFGKSVPKDEQELLNAYIHEGGFPYAIRLDSISDKRTYVQGLIDEIYKKDIQKRITIRNRTVFDAVMRYLINNFGATTSIRNIVEDMRKNGTSVKRETVNRYIEALVSAKIVMPCERFDMKSRKSLNGEKKYYLSDFSFYYALNTDNRINYGPALENIVFNYAASHDYKISVGRIGKLECDFILRDKDLHYSYVQVAYTILASKDTEDREYKSLEAIRGDNYPKYVVTTDKMIQERNGIRHINIIDFIRENRQF
ncbi:MAG: ATP-binding protein [Peptostreptococcaceae bacterium]|nr:ATP-binding protein [Peptostreptococcaceae bacterium]MDY5738791.1 ATP-binding protein [Anaerovoracaceae bacterium]